MAAKVFSATPVGLDATLVEVEVDVLSQGLHVFTLVGLPDTAIKESRERVSAALKNSGFRPPHQSGRITANLAPADLPKNSPVFDVPLALGYLLTTKQISFVVEKKLFIGELALDGDIRPVQGVLPIVLFAKEAGFEEVYVPEGNQEEASLVRGIGVFGVASLRALVDHLAGQRLLVAVEPLEREPEEVVHGTDMCEIYGQEQAKRALEIAAAGGHNVILVGSPGSGKTLLAKALPTILPRLSFEESLEVTKIYSVAGKTTRGSGLVWQRPFRAPHHTASVASLVGGGNRALPGELSLAHRGVLFLDEFTEFPRSVLEALRQPLEDGTVTVARVKQTHTFPAQCIFVAAMNPCPCGFSGDIEKVCTCSPYQVLRYAQKVSGPILDRIDLQIQVPRVKIEKFEQDVLAEEKSSDVRKRVEDARKQQAKRFAGPVVKLNAEMSSAEAKVACGLDDEKKVFLRQAAQKLGLSARGYVRVLKVSRTIADLEGSEEVTKAHLAEALQYRFTEGA